MHLKKIPQWVPPPPLASALPRANLQLMSHNGVPKPGRARLQQAQGLGGTGVEGRVSDAAVCSGKFSTLVP